MTAQPHSTAPHPGPPPKTRDGIRAALPPAEVARFDADYEKASRKGSEVVRDCLERWWGWAWSHSEDPAAHEQLLKDIRDLLAGSR